MESKSSATIPVGQLKTIKTIVVPYFISFYMAEAADPWRALSPKDFEILGDLCLRACGEPLGYKVDENSEIAKLVCLIIYHYIFMLMLIQTKTRLYELRNRMAAVGQDATKAKFVKQLGRAALEDQEKRIQFGLEWCRDGEFKFIYSGYDNGVSEFPIVVSQLSSDTGT